MLSYNTYRLVDHTSLLISIHYPPATIVAPLDGFGRSRLLLRLLLMLLVYEACIGLYYPAMATCRSKYIDDRVRGTVMNITRYEPSPNEVLSRAIVRVVYQSRC